MISLALKRAAAALMLLLLPAAGVLSTQKTNVRGTLTAAHVRTPKPDDQSLVETVSAKLAATAFLAGMDIKAEAKNGVVTLSGTVSSRAKKQLAVRIARSVKGTKRVVDHIEVARAILQDYECCCDGECYISSRPCPNCNTVGKCVAEYKGAIAEAHGNREAMKEARQSFYECVNKQ